jgi:phenylacetate-CoA ligase
MSHFAQAPDPDALIDAPTREADRYPTLSEAGRRTLDFMREHPAAPIFRNHSGNRLTAQEVESLRAYTQEVLAATPGWPEGGQPPWLNDFVNHACRDVPAYRGYQPLRSDGGHGAGGQAFEALPTICRADLAADIARFVPDWVEVDRLINFRTTGTTGNPLLIASHPLVAGRYLAYHLRALRRFGVQPRHGSGQVGVVLLGYQRKCFTYTSVTPLMGESGLAKINLHPVDWHAPQDRCTYLEAMAPEIIAGDPISFAELLSLTVKLQPRALLSVSMMLLPGLRQALETRFACPVLDLYSLNEVGPVAVFDPAVNGHVLLQHRLLVEILDPSGHRVPPGERGEITLTGGFNFCLPLLRYRTGDYAALSCAGPTPVLLGLSGRPPVRFRTAQGQWVNNIDVTHALGALALPQFGLHQRADGSLTLRLSHSALALGPAALLALRPLLGDVLMDVQAIAMQDKIVQYTTDLVEAGA